MSTATPLIKNEPNEDPTNNSAAAGPAKPVRSTGSGAVVHLGEGGTPKHQAALRNIANLRADLGVQWPVELVTLGPGITACLSASPVADQLQELIRQGATVVACANSLTGQNISRSELATGIGVVASGVGQLVRRQTQGWAYLRP